MTVPMDDDTKTSPRGGIQALANELGISIGTISRVLNNRPNVKPATRERVLEAVRKSGFVPNPSARRLKAHPILRLAMLSAPFHGPNQEVNPYATNLIAAVRRAAEEKGLDFTEVEVRPGVPLESHLPSNGADAVVLLGNIPATMYHLLYERRVSCVGIEHDCNFPGQVGIFSGARSAAGLAVQYLAALRHRRVALVTGPRGSSHFRNYTTGFNDAILEFDLVTRPEWQIELQATQSNRDGSAQAVLPLLLQPDRPSAIVFGSDWLALGAYTAARKAGLVIGRDVSIIGYDNLPIGAEQSPPLTSFDVNLSELGQTIVQLCIDLTVSGSVQRTVLHTQHQMVKRGSCGRLRMDDQFKPA